ncbi:MAG: TonB-dependent receptor [Verrucomicrobia bacterium]|nr:MAG: TonB-dependent receptor [Verrucomicrobiota bacterium]
MKLIQLANFSLTLIGVVLPLSASPESGGAEGSIIELTGMTIIGSRANVERLPGAGTFVDQLQITNQTYTDINKVLFQVPGVYVRQEDGYGLFANISLRGADITRSAKLTMMEDGVLTAPAPYSAPAAYYTPNAGRMRGLEVLKGSSQIAYGPHTTAGVINNLATGFEQPSPGYLKALVGSDDEWLVHFIYTGARETAAGRIGFLIENFYHRVGGFKRIDATPDFTDLDSTGFTRNEPMLKLFWEPETDTVQRLEFKMGYSIMDADETYLGLTDQDLADDPGRRYAASRFDTIDTNALRTSLRHTIQPTENLRIDSTLYYQTFHRNWFKLRRINDGARNIGLSEAIATPGTPLDILKGQTAGRLDLRNNNRDYALAGFEVTAIQVLEGFGWSHELEGSLRIHEDHVRRFQQDEMFTQNDTGVITDHQAGPPGGGGNRGQESRAFSAYLQDRATIGKLTLVPGLRYEHINYSYIDYNKTGNPDEITGRGASTVDVFVPGLGLNYAVDGRTSIYGGIYRGYSVPGPRAHAKSDVNLEFSIGYELGVRTRSDSGFFTEATVFYTDFTDLIVIDNIGGSGSGVTENIGDVNTYGLEFSAGYDLGPFIGEDWRMPVSLVATCTSSKLDGDASSTDPESIFSGGKDGNDVPYVPTWQFHISMALERKGAGIYMDATFLDGTYASASNVTNLINPEGMPDAQFGRTDSAVLLDLTARYPVMDDLVLFGGIKNALNQTFIAARHPGGARPGRPRSYQAGVEWRF